MFCYKFQNYASWLLYDICGPAKDRRHEASIQPVTGHIMATKPVASDQ